MATIERVALQQMELGALGAMGVEHFAHPTYRLEVAKRLAASTGTDHAIFFDDTAFAVPEAQRPLLAGLPGYERVLFPALLLAPGFNNGVSVLCAAPPNPVEIHNFKAMSQKMEQTMDIKIKVRLMYEQDDSLIDLMDVEEPEYVKMCEEYAKKMQDPTKVNAYTAPYHLNLMKKHAAQLLNYGKKAYVSPFQSTSEHHQALHELVEAETVVLPDMPNMDKAYNNFLLKKEGLDRYLHTMMAVHANGSISDGFDSYVQQAAIDKNNMPSVFIKTEVNVRRMANSILECTDRLANEGLQSIIKLDSNGVSGLGNLMPKEYPKVYDQTLDRSKRLEALEVIMNSAYEQSETLPQFAVVEEFIKAKKVDGFMHDLTAGGMMVDGVFMPMSMFPFATDKDGVYDRGWIAAQAKLVKEDPELWTRIFKAYGEMGAVMAKQGYRNGVLAGDILVREDGRIVFHDYNFRRGGRSTPEALIALLPDTGLFEVQLKIGPEQGLPHVSSNVELVQLYSKVCKQLTDRHGVYPFSTSFGYFGWGDGSHPFMKLKLLVPTELLEGQSRDKHSQMVQDLITNLFSS